MRKVLLAFAVIALAALACNVPGAAESPALEPVQPQPTAEVIQPPSQSSQPSDRPPDELTVDQIEQISRASVQILAVQQQGGALRPLWSGSGTIISPTGEIVTNCHVACGAPLLEILMTVTPDQPPQESYFAEITYADEQLDLAILQITTDINGNPVSPTNLPYLEIGDSDQLRLGDKIYIFGYPGVGGETITFTTGSVSGFESATVGGVSQRVIIKTDAAIASGNSGGTAVDLYGRLIAIPTAVNPDVREGVTIGGLGILRPVNLLEIVRQHPGAPATSGQASLPPGSDPDPYEPNDSFEEATGPVASGETITAYISWQDDVDFYFFEVSNTQPISASLSGPFGTDYDLFLLDGRQVIASSESTRSEETIEFSPPRTGRYWIAVASYSGASTSDPYTLTISYASGGGAGGQAEGRGITLTGQAVDGNSGVPLAGGTFGLLMPGVTCRQFFNAPELDMSKVVASGQTDKSGFFELIGVPTGVVYSAFFIYQSNYICEDAWLEVPSDAVDSDLGVIEMSFGR